MHALARILTTQPNILFISATNQLRTGAQEGRREAAIAKMTGAVVAGARTHSQVHGVRDRGV